MGDTINIFYLQFMCVNSSYIVFTGKQIKILMTKVISAESDSFTNKETIEKRSGKQPLKSTIVNTVFLITLRGKQETKLKTFLSKASRGHRHRGGERG